MNGLPKGVGVDGARVARGILRKSTGRCEQAHYGRPYQVISAPLGYSSLVTNCATSKGPRCGSEAEVEKLNDVEITVEMAEPAVSLRAARSTDAS